MGGEHTLLRVGALGAKVRVVSWLRKTVRGGAVVLLLWAATASASPALFTSRVAYEPLVAKLKGSGGDRSRIVRARAAKDLTALQSGKRYKFVVDEAGALAIAPLPADAAVNEYVHPILAAGGAVRTAGGITVEHADGKIAAVVVDQDSKAYCPTAQSLDEAVQALAKLGVATRLVTRRDRPPACAAR
ncbi:MAG: hypothetical protein JWN44_1844 [Myxococcales bacterium]|nr:hypothetical protein [Myxococcales bacterium]